MAVDSRHVLKQRKNKGVNVSRQETTSNKAKDTGDYQAAFKVLKNSIPNESLEHFFTSHRCIASIET